MFQVEYTDLNCRGLRTFKRERDAYAFALRQDNAVVLGILSTARPYASESYRVLGRFERGRSNMLVKWSGDFWGG